jgi:hypothetical protein
MEARIYKPKRLRNGKRTIGRLYRARVKLTGDNKVRDIPLKVSFNIPTPRESPSDCMARCASSRLCLWPPPVTTLASPKADGD